MQETMSEAFLDCLKSNPYAAFFIFFNERREVVTYSYEDSASIIVHTIRALRRMGLKKGDKVVCVLDDSFSIFHFFLACSYMQIIPIPLSPSFSTRYIRQTLVEARTKHVFTGNSRAANLDKLEIKRIVYAHEGAGTPFSDAETIWLHRGHSAEVAVEELGELSKEVASDSIFMIQPTSGSTGRPKLVLRTHKSLLRYPQFLTPELAKISKRDRNRFLMAPALTHAFGWHMTATALATYSEIAVPSKIDTSTSVKEVQRLNPSVLLLVPRVAKSIYEQLNQFTPPSEEINYPHLCANANIIISAGGTGDENVLKFFRNHGLEVIEIYGSSETSIISMSPPDKWIPRHAGFPTSDVEIQFSLDNEILIRSPGLMKGYFGDPAKTADAFTPDGFYKTGDLGELTESGNLRILGRKKDVFNTPEGSNIYPERIENMIESFPWVEQALLIGDGKPYLTALITLRDSQAHKVECYFDQLINMHALLPSGAAEHYERASADIEKINAELEEIEQIVSFVLINTPFPRRIYQRVGSAKARRNRKALYQMYKSEIAFLYSEEFLAACGLAQTRQAA